MTILIVVSSVRGLYSKLCFGNRTFGAKLIQSTHSTVTMWQIVKNTKTMWQSVLTLGSLSWFSFELTKLNWIYFIVAIFSKLRHLWFQW